MGRRVRLLAEVPISPERGRRNSGTRLASKGEKAGAAAGAPRVLVLGRPQDNALIEAAILGPPRADIGTWQSLIPFTRKGRRPCRSLSARLAMRPGKLSSKFSTSPSFSARR
jgi:hypothetical protein